MNLSRALLAFALLLASVPAAEAPEAPSRPAVAVPEPRPIREAAREPRVAVTPTPTPAPVPVPAPTPTRASRSVTRTSPGVSLAERFARLRACESGGDYTITNPSGKYRGAYQFSLSTWAAYGPAGDPAAASPAEQDRRALLLYEARGWAPWPECGRIAAR